MKFVCAYELWCPKHGHKGATWFVDRAYIEESFNDFYEKVIFKNHAECGTVTLIKETVKQKGDL